MALDFEEFSIFGRILLTFSHPVTRVVCLVVAGEGGDGGGEGSGTSQAQTSALQAENELYRQTAMHTDVLPGCELFLRHHTCTN